MRVKPICGVFKFKDNERYETKESLKEFSKYRSAEVWADKQWAKNPIYGGYKVVSLTECK